MIGIGLQRFKYVFGDFIASNIGWLVFNCIRYVLSKPSMELQGFPTIEKFLFSFDVILGQICVPIMVLCVFYISGYYNIVFRKSRLQELITTLLSTLIATMLSYLAVLINDSIQDKMLNYEIIAWLWACFFFPVYLSRHLITYDATRKIQGRKWSFPTLIIGNGKAARAFAEQLNGMRHSLGYEIKGFVNIPKEKPVQDGESRIYELSELSVICREQGIKELLIIPSKNNTSSILKVVNTLYPLNLPIKISPDIYHILLTNVKLANLTGEPLIDVAVGGMSEFSTNVKRVFDILFSIFALLILSPLFLILPILIKLDSKGTVFYKQERIGLRNIPFNIYKFRTMCSDAENGGIPLLSSNEDPRITKIGRIMRKYRLDELPQFYNVLKGEMSMVGPRPERKFFIDQIMETAPYYALLHQVKPGLTSLGMVKFGYASNVNDMKKRLKFDLLYIENMSLINDMKIMVYTIKTVFSGKGL